MQNSPEANTEQQFDEIFEQVRRNQAEMEKETVSPKANHEFKTLPNGNYVGRLYIQPNTVGSEKSKNYGLKKYELQFTVTEGEHKGKMAYFHYVIIDHTLSTPPPASDVEKHKRWSAAVALAFEKADNLLKKCGVNIADFDRKLIMQRIAENNRRKPTVNFDMVDGTPHINRLIKVEDQDDSLLAGITAPDGNDAPIV